MHFCEVQIHRNFHGSDIDPGLLHANRGQPWWQSDQKLKFYFRGATFHIPLTKSATLNRLLHCSLWQFSGALFYFWGLFFALRGRSCPEPPCNFSPGGNPTFAMATLALAIIFPTAIRKVMSGFGAESLVFCFLECQICVLRCSKFQILWSSVTCTKHNYDKAIIIAYNALMTVYSLYCIENTWHEARVNTANNFDPDFLCMQQNNEKSMQDIYLPCTLWHSTFHWFSFK